MAITPLAKLVTPDGSQKVAVPQDLWSLAGQLDGMVILPAADENDRNARYNGAKAQTVVATPDGSAWIKASTPPDPPVWVALRTKKVYKGFSWATGSQAFQDAGRSRIICTDDDDFDVYIGATYIGDAPIAGDPETGFLTDKKICTITDPDWAPLGTNRTFVVNGGPDFGGDGICYGSTGTVNISNCYPRASLAPGVLVELSFSFKREIIGSAA